MTYDWRRDGDDFLYTFVESGIAIGVTAVHEDRSELFAELEVKSTLPDQPGHVHWGRLNLSSTTSRDRLAATLAKRVKSVDWPALLEIAATRTAIEWRRGQPTIDLSTYECPEDDPFLIEPLLPKDEVTIIFGNGGSCKSMIAMALAIIAHEQGTLPGGIEAQQNCNVLYLDWESAVKNQLRRLYALARGMGLSQLPRIYYRPMRRPIWEEAAKLRAEISRLQIGLVVIDSIGYACVPEDINDAATALRSMGAARSLGCTCLVVAHVSKGSNQDGKSRRTPFGSIFFENSARSQWEIRRAEENEPGTVKVGLYHSKVNDGMRQPPLGLLFEFDGEDSAGRKVTIRSADVNADPELSLHTSLGLRLLTLLRNGKKTTQELAEETNSKPAVVRVTLARMTEKVVKLETGGGRANQTYWGLKKA